MVTVLPFYYVNSFMSYSIFGYGSLIHPRSVIARFSDEIPSIDPVYEKRLRYEENGIIRPEATEVLEESYSHLEFKPVKLRGFIRTYTFESERGGAMLETYYTGRDEDLINGVVTSGLNREQYEAINEYESAYDQYVIQPDEFELYEEASDYSINSTSTIYLGGQGKQSNWETSKVRNQAYHSRILKGIDQLGEIHNRRLRESFWKDFVENTYEHPDVTLEVEYEDLNQL